MKQSIILCSLACFALLAGCADDPKAIGNALLPPGDTFLDTTVTAYSDTTYRTPIVNGYSSGTLVGRLSTGEEFITLLDFYQTSILDSLVGSKIDTAEIRLTVNYRLLAASPSISLKVYEVLQSFSEGTFTSDTLQPSTVGTTELGTFTDSMNYSQQVIARIDTSAVRRWADDYLDTSKPDFYGFGIKMLTNSGVVGFAPFNIFTSISPVLVIKYTRNGLHDSLSFTYGQDTFVGTYAVAPVFADMEVRGGVGVRSKVKFDLKFLTGKPMVAGSFLRLTVDTVLSTYSGYTKDTLVAVLALPGLNPDSSNTDYIAYGLKKSNTGSYPAYEFQITNITQRWINELSVNDGVTIRWLSENISGERIVFRPLTDPVADNRPKLNILYSEKNQ